MNYQQVSSSGIMFLGYEPETQTMGIIFKSSGLSEYHYSSVPLEVFESVRDSPSIGQAVDLHIKKAGYKYERIL